ncbi:MAG: hypothetical protein AAGK47_05685, partial [Bacteroidota bacterium]
CPGSGDQDGQSYVIAGAIVANQQCTTSPVSPSDWSYDCQDEEQVELLGKGIKNNLPTSINIPSADNVTQIVAEAFYDNTTGDMPPYVIFTMADGRQQIVAPSALADAPNRFVFRTQLPSSGSVKVSQPDGYNAVAAEALLLQVYRNAGGIGTASIGNSVERFLSSGEETYVLNIPPNPAPRDVVVTVPLVGMRATAGRIFVNIAAGSVVKNIDFKSFNQGDALNLTPIILEDVPGEVTTVFVKITTPEGKQSVFLSSATAQVECFDCAVPEVSLPQQICAFNTSVFYAEEQAFPGVTYEWDFGSNATPQTASGAGPVYVVFDKSGTETVTLSINNNDQCINTITEVITVEDCDETTCGLDDVQVTNSDCYISDGSLLLNACEDCGTVYPVTVYYTYQGQEINAGTFNENNIVISELPAGVYTNIYLVDANDCQTNQFSSAVIDTNDGKGGSSAELCGSNDCTFFGVKDEYGRRSFWIPGLPNLNNVGFEWDDNGGNMERFADGTARITGRIINLDDNDCGFDVNILLTGASDWDNWSSQSPLSSDDTNRTWYGDANLVGNNYQNWTYYELDPTSTLTAFGCSTGTLQLRHNPVDRKIGVQVGKGATLFNTLDGMSFWFRYEGNLNGTPYTGEGDVNVEGGCSNSDTGIPVLTCPPCATISCEEELDPSLNPNLQQPIVNCGDADAYTLSYDDAFSGTCPIIVTRTWTATNGSITATCIQEITLEDNEDPQFVAASLPPVTLTVECDNIPAPASPEATDNCNYDITFQSTDTQGDEGCSIYQYTITRTWTVTDDCNNNNIFVQTINVQDDTAPELPTAPTDLTVECDQDVPAAIELTATDNCNGTISSLPTEER